MIYRYSFKYTKALSATKDQQLKMVSLTFAPVLNQRLLYKQCAAILILLAFLAQTFNKSFIVIDYYFNTSVFAQQCENKDKPQMHCNGKCQMMKQIKNEHKKEQQNPERKSENKNEITLSAKSYFVVNLSSGNDLSDMLFPDFICGKGIEIARSVFHPPADFPLS